MADDNKNNTEEEDDDFFDDDDDFGLPELDYGDEEGSDENEILEEETPMGDLDISEEDIDVDIYDTEVADASDLDMGSEDVSSGSLDTDDADSFSSMPGDSFDTPDEGSSDDFLGDDSFEDFDASQDSAKESASDSVFESNIFDDQYDDPGDQLETVEDEYDAGQPSSPMDGPSGSKGKFARIIIPGLILFLALGFGFWYAYNNTDLFGGKSKETAKAGDAQKTQAKKEPSTSAKPESLGEEAEAVDQGQPSKPNDGTTANAGSSSANAKSSSRPSKPSADKSATNKQASRPARAGSSKARPASSSPGSVNRIRSRTGDLYIIVGSFSNGDMANNFARKLASQGKSPSIIPPFGNARFHRVAIASYPSMSSARQNLENYRSNYGRDVWVLKY